ncbi:hypothetical protein GCM10010430_76570 [Kitasatospora cystarginea]|uniref:Transposase n=1 Tax=Kitasatospora cystarginea TaxID=58350 RepID=A0ABN3F0Z5_9ACTN
MVSGRERVKNRGRRRIGREKRRPTGQGTAGQWPAARVRTARWQDLEHHWRRFLERPEAYLRHLV